MQNVSLLYSYFQRCFLILQIDVQYSLNSDLIFFPVEKLSIKKKKFNTHFFYGHQKKASSLDKTSSSFYHDFLASQFSPSLIRI